MEMSKLSHRQGERVLVEVDGAWVEGLYVGYACGHGHVVRTSRTVVVIREEDASGALVGATSPWGGGQEQSVH